MRPLVIISAIACIFLQSCDGGGDSTPEESPAPSTIVLTNESFVLASPRSPFAYSTQEFAMPENVSKYYVSYDIKGSNLLDSDHGMTVFFDTPTVRSFSLYNVFTKKLGAYNALGDNPTFMDYSDEVIYRISNVVDIDNNLWILSIDGVEVMRVAFGATKIENLRFSFGAIDVVQDLSKTVEVSNLNVFVELK